MPISSLDGGYVTGVLSVYPQALDDKVTLYEARNNATSQLRQGLAYNGRKIILLDGSKFPPHGLVRVGPREGKPAKIVVPGDGPFLVGANQTQAGTAELLYYGSRSGDVLSDLQRGFAGSRQASWGAGSYVTNGVMAEHHNAVKDAGLNMERNLGTRDLPDPVSLNGILKALERRFLAPKPVFRAFPLRGAPPHRVRFQNFSGGDPIRYLWDFGDGGTSAEMSPTYTYTREGIYSVKLNMITSLGGQGIATKTGYITVSAEEGLAFFYADPLTGNSAATGPPTTFHFVDQSEGPIAQRIWDFDDRVRITVDDPDLHTISHEYEEPDTYNPTLLVIFEDQRFKRVFLQDEILVS